MTRGDLVKPANEWWAAPGIVLSTDPKNTWVMWGNMVESEVDTVTLKITKPMPQVE